MAAKLKQHNIRLVHQSMSIYQHNLILFPPSFEIGWSPFCYTNLQKVKTTHNYYKKMRMVFHLKSFTKKYA